MSESFHQILKMLRDDRLAGDTLSKLVMAPVRARAIQGLMNVDPKQADEIARHIRSCPTLTAMILSASNAIGFRSADEVFSIDDTLDMFEPHRVRMMALSFGASMLTYHSVYPTDLLEEVWELSELRALLSRRLCETIDPTLADAAFDLALIQDVGLTSLMVLDEDFYINVYEHAENNNDMLNREARHFGMTHTTAGMVLLGRWQGDDLIRKLIESSHTPQGVDPDAKSSLDILRLCVFFAANLPHWLDPPWGNREMERLFERFLSDEFASIDAMVQYFREPEARSMVMGTEDKGRKIEPAKLMRRALRASMPMTNYMVSSYLRLDARGKESLQQMTVDFQELRSKAFTDQLSGLLNRYGFNSLAKNRLAQAREDRHGACCILVDMDDFKPVNDTYGHAVGDKMIKGLAILMRRSIRKGDLVARLGGDEFAALICGVDADRAFQLGNLLSSKVEGRKIRVADNLDLELHATLGVVYCPSLDDDVTIDHMLHAADEAMYRRKHSGKHGVCFIEMDSETLLKVGDPDQEASSLSGTLAVEDTDLGNDESTDFLGGK